MRIALAALACAAAVLAAWKARRGASPALAAAGGVYALVLWAAAVFRTTTPWVACVLLHFEAMVVAKTLAIGRAPRGSVTFGRGLAFLAISPTLDARRAFVPDPTVSRPRGVAHLGAGVVEMLCGFEIAAIAARLGILDGSPYPASWVRAVCLLLLLDGFGRTFAGLARALGTASDDAFDRPWLAKDLAEFWGARWNQFIGRTLFHVVYKPWTRALGPLVASLLAFVASGILHEVLYVLPAGGQAGWYVLFFVLQGLGVIASSRMPSPAMRRAFCWILLLGTTPIFFGGAYPTAVPMENLLR